MASTPNSDDGGDGSSSPRGANYSHYDDLRASNVGSLIRKGNVDVLAASDMGGDGSNGGSEHEQAEEIALCHLAAMWRYSTFNEDPETGELVPFSLGPGFYGDSASVMMAIHHFNNGMGVVVDELEGINERCNLRFTVEFFDTYSSLPRTVETMSDLINRDPTGPPRPCAVLGAFRSAVSTPLAILTGVSGLPQLSPVSSSPDLDNTALFPLFSRLVPSDAGTSLLTAKYFIELGVTHVGVIFVDDAYGNAYHKAFKRLSESLGLTVASFSFGFKPSHQEISNAISGLKSTNYRYFFGIIFGPEHYDIVMEEAFHQGIAGRAETPTFWIFGGGVQRYVQNVKYRAGSPLARVTHGTGMIQADGGIEGMPGFDRYLEAWQSLGDDEIAYFNRKQPLDHYVADPDYFKRNDPERESVFAYDSVIALGLAACKLLEHDAEGAYFEGKEHFEQFISTSFVGASGTVVIDPETTSREPQSALYVIFNAVANEPDENDYVSFKVDPAVIHLSSGDGWQSVKGSPFVFNDNTLNPPAQLPPLSVNMNYIGTGLRVFGIILSSIVILSSFGFILWVLRNRGIKIVRASQPIFLILICFGTLVMGTSIIPLSIDDEIASIQACNAACMAVPWLYTIGFVIAFAALFSKTWRINMILKARTIRHVKISAWDVMLPFACLVAANVLVLSLWTALSPLQWKRELRSGKDEFGRSIESHAGCMIGKNTAMEHLPYILTLVVIDGAVLIFANIQAYRARDIRTEFSESRYIAITMGSILQAWVIGIPLMFVVVDDPQAQYLVLTCIITVGSMAILYLIMIPKFLMRKKRRARSHRRSSECGLDAHHAEEERMSSIRISGIHVHGAESAGRRAHSVPNLRLQPIEGAMEEGVDRDDSEYSHSCNSSHLRGVAVVPHAAEQQNAILMVNLRTVKKDKKKILEELKGLLNKTQECAEQTVRGDDIRKIVWRYDDDYIIRR